MPITDLTGTKWTFKSSLNTYADGTYTFKEYDVYIECDEQTGGLNTQTTTDVYESIGIGYLSGAEQNQIWMTPVGNDTAHIWASGSDTKTLPDTWGQVITIPFTITGGSDAQNSALIAWFEANADQIEVSSGPVYYTTSDTELKSVADAIREKGGTSASLVYPDGFISAIDGIQTGGGTIKVGGVRPDAELVGTWTDDFHIVADKKATIPAYTTTATVLKESQQIDTYTFDPTNYYYLTTVRALTIPEYSANTTKGAGCQEFTYSYGYGELKYIVADTITSIDKTVINNSNLSSIANISSQTLHVYYSSSTVIKTTTSAYGISITLSYPSVNGLTFRIYEPNVTIRGQSSYFSQTYFEALEDARCQYVTEIWRVPIVAGGVGGWQNNTQLYHGLNCIYNNNCKLT